MGITNNEEDLLLRIKSNNVTVLHDHIIEYVRTQTQTLVTLHIFQSATREAQKYFHKKYK